MTGNSEMGLRGILIFCIILVQGCVLKDKAYIDVSACGQRHASEDAQLTPEIHYSRMQSCLKAGQTRRALDHFALAGTSTWYDAQIRSGEITRKRHQSLLQSALKGLDTHTQERAWNDFSIMMKNRKQLESVCSYMESIAAQRRQLQVFDDLAWDQAREGYLHCASGKAEKI